MNNRKLRKKLLNTFSEKKIDDIARYSQFKKRNSGKLKPLDFLWLACFSGKNICTSSLEEMTAHLFLDKNILLSPQALDQRIEKQSVEFFKNIFLLLLKDQSTGIKKFFNTNGFRNIFLMDSTEIKLPDKLRSKYRGAQQQSTLKINLILELLTFSVKNIAIDEGVKNELTFSKYLYDYLTIDSLVLKDLGYFKFEDFEKIENKNSFFISRLKAGTRLFSINSSPEYHKNGKIKYKTKYSVTNAGKLGTELKVGETKEYEFLVGENKVPTRIILTKLNETSLNERLETIRSREKRNENCAKLARESIEISGYITNLWGFSSSEVIELYRMRWQIELLFKIFKSDFNIDKLKDLKVERIEAHIYATLIRILLLLEITRVLENGYSKEISVRRGLKASILILSDFLVRIQEEDDFELLCLKLAKLIKSKIKK